MWLGANLDEFSRMFKTLGCTTMVLKLSWSIRPVHIFGVGVLVVQSLWSQCLLVVVWWCRIDCWSLLVQSLMALVQRKTTSRSVLVFIANFYVHSGLVLYYSTFTQQQHKRPQNCLLFYIICFMGSMEFSRSMCSDRGLVTGNEVILKCG